MPRLKKRIEALEKPARIEKAIQDGRIRTVGSLDPQADGKRLCGLCGHKSAKKGDWTCTKTIPQPTLKKYELFSHYPCPAPDGDCPGFEKCPQVTRPTQTKPERLAVPPGMIFLYINRVTIAVLLCGEEVSPNNIHMGFAFCHSGNPKKGIKPDRFCKATGRNVAMKHLCDDPLIIGYLYDPIRVAREVTRAVLSHDFGRLSRFADFTPHFKRQVPGWTTAISKRFYRWVRLTRKYGRVRGHKIPLDLKPGKIMQPSKFHAPGPLARIITDILRMPL
jgi:hypothetical protein